jgi:deoxyribodipyrimidine photo-lyase
MKVLWWVTEDLRLDDNWILQQAQGHELIVAWHPSPSFLRAKSHRRNYGWALLQEFSKRLQSKGLTLLGPRTLNEKADWLLQLIRNSGVARIYRSRSWGTEELEIESELRHQGCDLVMVDHNALLPLGESDSERRLTEEVFTKWRRRIEAQLNPRDSLPVAELRLGTVDVGSEFEFRVLEEIRIPFHPRLARSESAAQEHLRTYFHSERPSFYKETRNGMLKWEDSTKLSPYLAWGLLSPHSILRSLHDYERRIGANDSTAHLVMELLWREYFRRILAKKGSKVFSQSRDFADDPTGFEKWTHGETGEPFVDAHMIELKKTGWMSNRGRQIVASYLAKTLRLDWRLGAAHLEALLLDYDVHSNWGNWAYVAGVGQDPRDRIFNPRTQAERYDPDASYQRYWLSKRD